MAEEFFGTAGLLPEDAAESTEGSWSSGRNSGRKPALEPGESLASGIMRMGPQALEVLRDLLDDPTTKPQQRWDIARFLLEKIDGKAAQKIDVAHSSLDNYMDLLKQMRASGEVLDVTPAQLIAPVSTETTVQPEPTEEQDSRTWARKLLSGG